MFGEKAFDLIKELDRNSDNLPAFNVNFVTVFATNIIMSLYHLFVCRMKSYVKFWMK